MLVHALCLRSLGVKLTREQLRAQTPLVGQLSFKRSVYGNRDDRGIWVCSLMAPLGRAGPGIELLNARLLLIEPRGLLVGGEEDLWERKKRTTYAQVLWAWPVGGERSRVPPPGSTVDSMKFIETLASLV